jgi:hypothetical protein
MIKNLSLDEKECATPEATAHTGTTDPELQVKDNSLAKLQ